jgi:dCTP diphosphatase
MPWNDRISLEELRRAAEAFAEERDWAQYHSPRNLLLAVMSEVGEAAEILRWQGDDEHAVPAEKAQAWSDELADILILLIRLADRSGVDLGQAFQRKLALAAERYPAEEFRGSSRKYNEES